MSSMNQPYLPTCSCGDAGAHVIMRRRTADGIEVCLWENGAVTGALGIGIRGVPVRRPRSEAAVHHARCAGRLMLGEVCLYNADELGALYAASDRAARGDGLPGTVRRIMRERAEADGLVVLQWTVVSADRDGRPTERVVRLPRLRWPGLVLFDFCGGPGSSSGRYVLFRERDGACYATGFSFRRLSDLWAHLRGAVTA